jgi:hypothetical protein
MVWAAGRASCWARRARQTGSPLVTTWLQTFHNGVVQGITRRQPLRAKDLLSPDAAARAELAIMAPR